MPHPQVKVLLPVTLNELSLGQNKHLYARLKPAIEAELNDLREKDGTDQSIAVTHLKLMRDAVGGHLSGTPQRLYNMGHLQDSFIPARHPTGHGNEIPLLISVTGADIDPIVDKSMAFRLAAAIEKALASMPDPQPHPVMPTFQTASREEVADLLAKARLHAAALDRAPPPALPER